MAYKISKGARIDRRYRIILIRNRYYIVDYTNFKLPIKYTYFAMLARTSYPAWEITEEDLKKIKYENSTQFLKPINLLTPNELEAQLGGETSNQDLTALGGVIGFALVPMISALPGWNIPIEGRIVVSIISIGLVLWFGMIKSILLPNLEVAEYQPVVLARKESSFGEKMTGLRLFGRSLVFLICISIQAGAIYAWITIPFNDFNVILYLVAMLFACGPLGYFGSEPWDKEVSTESNSNRETLVKYTIIGNVNDEKLPNKTTQYQMTFFIYFIVWLLILAIVHWSLSGVTPFAGYMSSPLGFPTSIGISLIAVFVASRNHDGYKLDKHFRKK